MAVVSVGERWRTAAREPSQTPPVVAMKKAASPSVAEMGRLSPRSSATERSRYLVESWRSPWRRPLN